MQREGMPSKDALSGQDALYGTVEEGGRPDTVNPDTHLGLSALRLLFLFPLHALCCQIEPLLVAILVQDQVLGCTAISLVEGMSPARQQCTSPGVSPAHECERGGCRVPYMTLTYFGWCHQLFRKHSSLGLRGAIQLMRICALTYLCKLSKRYVT